MPVIAVINQKGGVGKTMLSLQLAGTLQRAGLSTLLIDTDPQGTASRWVAAAPEGAPSKITSVALSRAGDKLHQEVRKFVDKYAMIIVDCPPNAESLAWQSVLMIADIALIPVRPDPGDLLSTVEFVRVAEEIASRRRDKLQMRFVASNIRNGVSSAASLENDLKSLVPEIPLLRAKLSQRTAFPQAFATGDSVHALGAKARPAIEEADALCVEVCEILANLGSAQ